MLTSQEKKTSQDLHAWARDARTAVVVSTALFVSLTVTSWILLLSGLWIGLTLSVSCSFYAAILARIFRREEALVLHKLDTFLSITEDTWDRDLGADRDPLLNQTLQELANDAANR